MNPNAFCEYVGKDSKGQRIVQGIIHEEIHQHIDYCTANNIKNCGILAPWGHGKTEQVIFRVLQWIGQDVNKRIQYICNTDSNATARVTTVKRYIEQDKEYHATFPWVKPAQGEDWGKHKIVVQRTSLAKDGTLEAWGITSSGTGSRADIQVFDDPVDLRNTILNPAMRLQVSHAFKNVWQSRLVPRGFRVYVATVWHEADLTHEIMKSAEWCFLKMAISADFTCIECESPYRGKYTIQLWNAEWTEQKLKEQYRDIGSVAFDRGYRQVALNDESRTFPSSDQIFKPHLGFEIVQPHWPRIAGIDPFGRVGVIVVMAVNPNTFQRVVLEIIRRKMPPKQMVQEIISVYHRYNCQVMVCENNASQEAIIQWVTEVGGLALPIVPFTTGKQKADPVLGLPSLEVEFANGAWIVPIRGVDGTDANHPLNVLKYELRAHPVAEAEDTVMALWFAREGARYITEGQTQQAEEIITQEDVGIETVEISSTY